MFDKVQTKTLASNLPDRNYDIFYKNVNLDNVSSNKTLNPSNNSGYSEHPHIASSGNNINLIWVDNSNGYKQVFLRSREDVAKTFSESILLSNDNVSASRLIFIQMINMYSLSGNNLCLPILWLLCGLVIIWINPLVVRRISQNKKQSLSKKSVCRWV